MFDIVMPLFNKEKFVADSIASVLAQTYQQWRLIIVDDGSADGSVAAVEKFRDPRITLMRQENDGPGTARNRGIAAGHAEWIAFLDADDVWLNGHLQTLHSLRAQFSDAALIGTAYRYWDGGPCPQMEVEARSGQRISYFREIANGRALFWTGSVACRRQALEEVGAFKPLMLGEDIDLWARLALHGPVAFSATPTALYRTGTGGIIDSHAASPADSTPPTEPKDVSPVIATLTEQLKAIDDAALRQDILDYIDHELGIAMIQALHSGQIDRARKLIAMFSSSPQGKARAAVALARLPHPVGQRIFRLILSLKRGARAIARR